MTASGTKLRPLLKGQRHLLSVTMKKNPKHRRRSSGAR